MRGPLVIYDPEDPHARLYDIDNGEIDVKLLTTFSDFFSRRGHRYHTRRLVPLRLGCGITVTNTVGESPYLVDILANNNPSEFNSTLINGRGRYPGGPQVPLAVVNVQRNRRSVVYLSFRTKEEFDTREPRQLPT